MNEIFPVLYILMRNDLPSMNAGKAMAQASHASNAFVHYTQTRLPYGEDENDVDAKIALTRKWQEQTPQGFGTVIVLSVNEQEMRSSASIATSIGFVSGIVNDPTYPILVPPELGRALRDDLKPDSKVIVGDGDRYVTINEDTCAYVFGDKNSPLLGAVLGQFSLHP